MNYKPYAALAEEENEGWVWFKNPQLPTRTLVKIHNPNSGRTVFCQSRHIDENFLQRYKEKKHTIEIAKTDEDKALVVGEWYRDALGGLDTQKEVCLHVSALKIPVWSDLRAACHHPDIVARIGTRLGVIGVWLGLVGIAPLLLEFFDTNNCIKSIVKLAIAAIGVLLIAGCRGV